MPTMISKDTTELLPIDPHTISINREIRRSDASSIFEIAINGKLYAMKVFHDNGDPGLTKKGRDLNRFRCELKAYLNLYCFGVCEHGYVPRYHGHIDRLDPTILQPYLNHFRDDQCNPRAILLEYLPDAMGLNCENYSDQRWHKATEGIKKIHDALIHHHDIYPKNILIVPGVPERVLWIDFDVAVTFPSKELMGPKEDEYSQLEIELVSSFGKLLQEDQRQGLPPNTKYY